MRCLRTSLMPGWSLLSQQAVLGLTLAAAVVATAPATSAAEADEAEAGGPQTGTAAAGTTLAAEAPSRLRVLIVDGQNNHDWQTTTPLLVRIYRESGRFAVDVATAPAEKTPTAGFRPDFASYDVVLGNYNGARWPAETEQDFLTFLKEGGGFVCLHAADNSFPDWPEYNQVCGLGGWYGRDYRWGPYVYYRDDKLVRDTSKGRCGSHGPQHEYAVRARQPEHPILAGLPEVWMHAQDELYDSLRGPAKNMQVLATAWSDPELRGTGRDEPILMTIDYGKGRVFHTVLGHADYSLECVGFITTLLRGTEWAATGEVTIPVPDDFPTADKVSSRDL